jgi:hypothetical protein
VRGVGVGGMYGMWNSQRVDREGYKIWIVKKKLKFKTKRN